jgi:hypothetical protein
MLVGAAPCLTTENEPGELLSTLFGWSAQGGDHCIAEAPEMASYASWARSQTGASAPEVAVHSSAGS